MQRQAPSIMDNSPRQIREALEQSDDWADFDILELERLTDKRCVRRKSGDKPLCEFVRNRLHVNFLWVETKPYPSWLMKWANYLLQQNSATFSILGQFMHIFNG